MHRRGKKKTEELCPKLEEHIHCLVDPEAQADPKFQTTFVFTRITAKAVQQALEAEPEFRPVSNRLTRYPTLPKWSLTIRPEDW